MDLMYKTKIQQLFIMRAAMIALASVFFASGLFGG